jgi:hypothetical protein
MKFTITKLEEAIIELLGEEDYPHVSGELRIEDAEKRVGGGSNELG